MSLELHLSTWLSLHSDEQEAVLEDLERLCHSSARFIARNLLEALIQDAKNFTSHLQTVESSPNSYSSIFQKECFCPVCEHKDKLLSFVHEPPKRGHSGQWCPKCESSVKFQNGKLNPY